MLMKAPYTQFVCYTGFCSWTPTIVSMIKGLKETLPQQGTSETSRCSVRVLGTQWTGQNPRLYFLVAEVESEYQNCPLFYRFAQPFFGLEWFISWPTAHIFTEYLTYTVVVLVDRYRILASSSTQPSREGQEERNRLYWGGGCTISPWVLWFTATLLLRQHVLWT